MTSPKPCHTKEEDREELGIETGKEEVLGLRAERGLTEQCIHVRV